MAAVLTIRRAGAPSTSRSFAWRLTGPAGLLVAVLVTLPAWLPWLDPHLDVRLLDDGQNHLLRLYQVQWLLQHDVWYPRWLPDLFLGYGYPVLNYYAPGFYYLSLALGALFRLDLWDAFRAAGVAAVVLAVAGTYAFVTTVWRRPALGVLGAALLLYAPYAFQTNLFKRGDLPEALGLAVIPWLLLAIWGAWTAGRAGRAALGTVGTAAAGTAALLLHNLTVLAAGILAAAWVLYLLTAAPGSQRWAPLGRLLLAGGLALGLTAFFWLPAATEGGAVQLEWLRDGDLFYTNWLLDLGGQTKRQEAPSNRQTPAGPIDLHLRYPHQLTAAPKVSLGQAGAGVLALLALAAAARWARRPAAPSPPRAGAAPPAATIPFWLGAVLCWALTFTFSAPLWERVPALGLMQFPWRLMGPLAVALAVAIPGTLAPALQALEAEAGRAGRAAGVLLITGLTLAVAFNGASDRALPLEELEPTARVVDAQTVVYAERRDPQSVGTTSGREFLPRAVQVPLFTRGAYRYKDVITRLHPEEDWLGGRFTPLAGDLRFLSWRSEPLRLTARVANDGAAPASVGVRQAIFPAWRAWLDGRPLPLDVSPYVPEQQANPGFIVLHVPPGEHTVSLAFGPTPAHLAGMGLTLGTVAAAGLVAASWAGRGRRWSLLASALAATGLLTAGTGFLTWRGVRPMLQPFAAALPAPPPAATAGVWQAPDLSDGGSGRNGLLVNLAEAVRQGAAVVSSPTGAVLGPEQFVDVRQLTVPDEEDPLRGAPGTSRREWLYLHPPSEVSVDVSLPPGRQAWLQAALALDPAVWRAPTGDGVLFTASLTPLDADGATGGTVVVLKRAVNPRARTEERRWLPVQADLSRWAGQTVRLTLRTLPGHDITYDWAGWANPCVVVTDQARAPVE